MYNATIKHLMATDHNPDQITCTDKLAVRDWVKDRCGDILIPLVYVSDRLKNAAYPFAVKCTHDSGSCVLVKNPRDYRKAHLKITRCLKRTYGVGKGEWAYQHIKPMVIAEKLLAENTDYKFHCVDGEIKWVQVIWNRPNTKEAIFTPDGIITDLHMDEKMTHCPDQSKYPGKVAWNRLCAIASELSKGWQYVRVDLYWSDNRPYFGEMTFYPRGGNYKSKDEPIFGQMLGIL